MGAVLAIGHNLKVGHVATGAVSILVVDLHPSRDWPKKSVGNQTVSVSHRYDAPNLDPVGRIAVQ
jgi:hypothetical protein